MIFLFKNNGSSRGLVYMIPRCLRLTTTTKCLAQRAVTTT